MKSVLIDSAFSLAYRIMSAVFSYGMYMGIPLLFGITALGVFALYQALLAVMGVMLSLGLHLGLLKSIAKTGLTTSAKALYIRSLLLVTGLSLLAGLALLSFGHYGTELFPALEENTWVFGMLALTLPFQTILLINIEVLRALQIIKLSELLRNLLIYVLAVLLMLVGYFNSLSFHLIPVAGFSIGIILTSLLSLFLVLKRPAADTTDIPSTQIPGLRMGELLKNSLPMMGSALVQNWNSRVMTILLGILAQAEAVAVFGLAFKLSTIPDFFISAIKAPTTPLISKYFAQGNWKQLVALLQKSVLYSVLLIIPVAAILLYFASELLELSGSAFAQGSLALQLLVCAQVASASFGLTGAFLNMTRHQNVLLIAVSAGLIINVAMCWMLIPFLGVTGAAIGFLSSTLIWNGICTLYIYHSYGIKTFPAQLPSLKLLAP